MSLFFGWQKLPAVNVLAAKQNKEAAKVETIETAPSKNAEISDTAKTNP